jgi:rhamnose transport system ATP-binding protein
MIELPLLTAARVRKSYGGVSALRDASFELRAGEVHALVGENGAGKSTLIKILTGAVTPDDGEIHLNGNLLIGITPHKARALGIIAIYQQPALFPDLSVAENIALANESSSLFDVLNWKIRREKAREVLDRIGARIHPDALVATLSMAEQQLVEIARALRADARVLILDEPTASLTDQEADRLFSIIRDLRSRGVGLIYISHRLDELFQIADRVTVLRDGAVVGTKEMAGIDRPRMIEMMVGRELSSVFPKFEVPIGEIVFETEGLSVRCGEIVGLAGMVGSGRTEFAEEIFGLRQPRAIRVNGQAHTVTSPSQAISLGIAYVPEDRRRNGLIMEMPIPANITLPLLGNGFLHPRKDRAVASEYREKLQIKAPSLTAPVKTLSGGNQQKVSLARWLATNPLILILDEPTQGIDVGAKSEIHQQMCKLAQRGMAILMISSELPELLGMSDRIAVMHEGRIAGTLTRADATQEKLLALAIGSRAA